jgi:hypothetical protein
MPCTSSTNVSAPYYPKIQPSTTPGGPTASRIDWPVIDTIRLRILLVALSGWVNRHQHDVIDPLRQENRVLNEHLYGRRGVESRRT